MTRTLITLAALAVAAAVAVPASAYTPNPDDPTYGTPPFPCIKCGLQVQPGDKVINPGVKRGFNPQPDPPGVNKTKKFVR